MSGRGSGVSLLGPKKKPIGTLRRSRKGLSHQSCFSLRSQAPPISQPGERMGGGGEGKAFWEIELSLPSPQEGVKNREKKVISRIPNYPTSQMHPFLLLHTSGLRSRSSLPRTSFPLLCSRPKPVKPSFLQAADQG